MFFSILIKKLLDYVAPIECLGCNTHGTWLCNSCKNSLLKSQTIVINNYDQNISKVICAFDYKNSIVQKLLHVGKYDGVVTTIEILAVFLNTCLQENIDNNDLVFIPIPLHPSRQRDRGFNQSEIIANVLTRSFASQVINCQRLVNTPHQVGLNAQQRQKNMANVFSFNNNKNRPTANTKIAVIVDDVITTGATIKSLATVIAPQFKTIYAVALAKE